MSDPKHDDDEYHSSSDEDYDPEKDIDPQDEIDDNAEAADDLVDEVEEVKKTEEPKEKKDDVDVDALFRELTEEKPKEEKKAPAVKVYPKSVIAQPSSSASSSSSSSSLYPKTTSKLFEKPLTGTKRVGILDAAKSLSKKSKISTLEQSDRDWKQFTSEQNITQDLQSHNRGKGGYLNKIDFLNRVDNQQFEKERALRATARKE